MFLKSRRNPFARLLLGCILLLGSFALLFINEGAKDLSITLKEATRIDLNDTATIENNEFVAAYGIIISSEKLGDEFIKNGDYLVLERNVEIYAREEHKRTYGEDIYYNYRKTRTTEPQNSNTFKEKTEHKNNFKAIHSFAESVNNAKMGKYRIHIPGLYVPKTKTLKLDESLLKKDNTIKNNKIRLGSQNIHRPKIGDIRISYKVVEGNKDMTIFGKTYGNTIKSYTDEKGRPHFRLFRGEWAQAFVTSHPEYTNKLRGIRIVGILLMRLGLNLMLGILTNILEAVPLIGRLSVGVTRLTTLIIAIVLSGVIIFVRKITHSGIAILVLAIVVGSICIYRKGKKKATKKKVARKTTKKPTKKKVVKKSTKKTTKKPAKKTTKKLTKKK